MAGKNNDDIENLPSGSGSSNRDDIRRSNMNDTPDLGMGLNQMEHNPRVEHPRHERREENPFSFKKFLNQDCGTRRKEYASDGTPVPPHNPEMASILPDFVQDHLVVEQCYLSSPSHHGPISFDLPITAEDRPDPSIAMSLPDFLSDGPIHSQRNENQENPKYLSNSELAASNGHVISPNSSTRDEIDNLQREIDYLRRQLHDRNRKVNRLESEVTSLHNRDARDTDSLGYALLQAETNLRQNSKRMLAAENTVMKLKNENKILRSRIESLEGNQGAAACSSTSNSVRSRNQRLAQDLRAAAAAAEVHVKSLSSGIDNLKMLASAVEDQSLFCDYDDIDVAASGPAL